MTPIGGEEGGYQGAKTMAHMAVSVAGLVARGGDATSCEGLGAFCRGPGASGFGV